MSGLEIKGVNQVFGKGTKKEFTALKEVNLSINKGEFVALLGPSGCGKSTLLHLFSGLSKPEAGQLFWDQKEIQGPSIERGLVFQHYSLFPWMSTVENLLFALRQKDKSINKKEALTRVNEVLKLVGLEKAGGKYPIELSGGMQQRVAIARVLLLDSPLFLLDEPFGALDAITRSQLQELFLRLWQERTPKPTVVLVTHDLDEAIYLADRIVVMQASPGRIVEDITVPWSRPRNRHEITTQPILNDLRFKLLDLLEVEKEVVI